MIDPLDTGTPSVKRWEEFRAQYAGATLLAWVFKDLRSAASEAVADLSSRLGTALDSYPDLLRQEAAREGVEWDGEVPFHGPDGDIAFWAPVEMMQAIEESLFPHRSRDAKLDGPVASAVLVALHAALEAYARAVGVVDARKGLPNGIRDWLEAKGSPFPAALFDVLVDFDATRHITVHNRGMVDEKYVRKVRDPQYLVGEFRLLPFDVIDRFMDAVQKCGTRLHELDR
jgi:hypothetical protein